MFLFFPFHRPENKISDLRSVETPLVHSSTEFQHLIIFSAVVACRCFAYQLGCCCVFFCSSTQNHFWRVISRSLCLTITMGYCYACLLYNFHPHIPSDQNFKLLDDQNTFKTQSEACEHWNQIFQNKLLISVYCQYPPMHLRLQWACWSLAAAKNI